MGTRCLLQNCYAQFTWPLLFPSPFLTAFFPEPLGNIKSLLLYVLSRSTFSCRLSVHLFRRRWSTAMPMLRASFGEIFTSRSSSKVKPLPSRSFMLYRWVG